jgi:hypothetical protein
MKLSKTKILSITGLMMLALYAPHAFAEGKDGSEKGFRGEIRQEMRTKDSDNDNENENENESKSEQGMRAVKSSIEAALKANDYTAFTTALAQTPFAGKVSQEQFTALVKAYGLYQSGDVTGAQAALVTAKIDPTIVPMVKEYMKAKLTDAQKIAVEQAKKLFDAGKIDEAKAVLTTAGLPAVLPQLKSEDMKRAVQKAKELQKSGDVEGAKKILEDAGIPDRAIDKIAKELPRSGDKRAVLEQAKQLRKSGDVEGAKKLMDDAKVSKGQQFFFNLRSLFAR